MPRPLGPLQICQIPQTTKYGASKNLVAKPLFPLVPLPYRKCLHIRYAQCKVDTGFTTIEESLRGCTWLCILALDMQEEQKGNEGEE
jgi:hypothetical protein